MRRIVVHELTHFFDFNCWKSWSYKDEVTYEHLATFNEIYHEPIEKLTHMIVEWCLTQEIEIKKPKVKKTKFRTKKTKKEKYTI